MPLTTQDLQAACPQPDGEHPSGIASALRADTLADSVVILLVLTVVQRLIGFCRAVLFCRWLDPGQLGQWDMAFSFLMLAAPLSILALSSSFGRYVEHYCKRGQLRAYLRRTAVSCAFLAVLAFLIISLGRPWFSQLIFGSPDQTGLVSLLAGSLVVVIAVNYFIDLLTAMRNIRLLSLMHLFNSLAFAVLGICLLLGWRQTAVSVVIAYAGACCLTALGVAWIWRASWHAIPVNTKPLSQRAYWSKVIPYVGWISLASLMANLFAIVDRYMIIHHSPVDTAGALAMVGQYHSSRVVPMLLLSIALMLGGMITPHLSHDWEAGRRDRVGMRLNLFMKLLGFALSGAAVLVLFAAPLLFGVAFQGKFAGGLAVLPWTLIYCIWFGMAMVADNYLLCAEKARLITLALVIGLVVNIGLNLVLLPRLGLLGAVLATTVANLLAMLLICLFAFLLGFRIDAGTRLVLMAPLALCAGPLPATVVLLAIAVEAVRSDRLLSQEEKHQLAEIWLLYRERFLATGLARPLAMISRPSRY